MDEVRGGMHVVFDNAGAEHHWKLEPVSARELLALLLKGEMRRGGRVLMRTAEATIEPPERHGGEPAVCVSLGHVELCFTMDRMELGALSKDIAKALKS
jgi:hypothetical protein